MERGISLTLILLIQENNEINFANAIFGEAYLQLLIKIRNLKSQLYTAIFFTTVKKI